MTNDEIDALDRLLVSAKMLQQNALGCAENHYGHDFQIHGTPGWLIDTATDIGNAKTALETLRRERDEAVELLDTASDLLWEHCEGLAPRIEPIDAFLTRIEGKDT